MDGVLKPQAQGAVARGPSVLDDRGFIPKYPLPVGRATDLRGLAREYAFFTPAVLYLHAGFRDAPLADLCATTGVDVRFYYHKFARPVFAGLEAPSNGNPDWNFVLWAVQLDHWPLVSDWLVSVTLTYAETREVAGIGQQELDVYDPLAADRAVILAPTLPLVRVAAFGLNGSRCRAYLAPPADPVAGRPTLAFDRPAADMRTFAAALYGGANPVDARQAHLRKAQPE